MITVAHLREMLKDFPDETVVHIGYKNFSSLGVGLVTPAAQEVKRLELARLIGEDPAGPAFRNVVLIR